MAYTPRNYNFDPGRSSGRPGKRSARPAFERSPRPFTQGASAPMKKPRWVPRTGKDAGKEAVARTPREFGKTRTPSPFPQKPPYRPNGPSKVREPFSNKPRVMPGAKSRYGFLPSQDHKRPFMRKPFTPHPAKAPLKFKPAKPARTQFASYARQKPEASWGGVATWYDKHLASPDTYHEKVILPNLLRLVEPQKNELILDLASGQGYFARALAEKGASLTGLEISPELIALAQKKGGAGVTYKIGSAEDLSALPQEYFSKAVVVLAIQNIEHIQKVFTETVRVIKKDGTLHIVMNHPAFRIPKHSSWGYDEKEKLQYRRVDQYLSESREEIDMHPGMKDSPRTLSFHRPLQYYVKALAKAGFVIDRFEEWISHKESDSGPRTKAENRARKEIPLFLYMRARKI